MMRRHIGSKGSALLVSLVLIIAMSGMGVIAVNQAVREVRMASSFDSSARMLTYAEAVVDHARRIISEAPTPELTGFNCSEGFAPENYWPQKGAYDRGEGAVFCITLIGQGEASQEGSGSSGSGVAMRSRNYYYRVDALVMQKGSSESAEPVVVKHVQSIERFTRLSN